MSTLNTRNASKQLERNIPKIMVLAFFQVFLVIMPVAVPFFMSRGLDMQGVFALQAMFALIVVVTEVPSGYLADLFGRRNTLVFGSFIAGFGPTALLFTDGPMGLVIFEVCLAIGHSLVSGSDLALVYDSQLAVRRRGRNNASVVGQLYSSRSAGDAIAAVTCSVILLFGTMEDTLLLQAVLAWLPFLIALSLVEAPGSRLTNESHRANMGRILRHLWRSGGVLRYTFVALSIWSLTTFYAVWLLQKLWQEQGIPLMMFGYLWAGLSLLGGLCGQHAHRLEARLGVRRTLLLLAVLPIVGYLTLNSGGIVIGLAGAALFYVARGVGVVVLREALNQRVPGEFRATANSLASFAFRGAFAITGPLVGFVFDWWGMTTTLLMLAATSLLIFFGTLLPLINALKRGDDVIEDSQPCQMPAG